MNIKEQHIVAGMTTDMNVSKFEPTKVLYARNVRITQVDSNQGLLCVTNEKGTKQCTFTGDSIVGNIVGSATLNNYLVLFTEEDLITQQATTVHTDFIYRLEQTNGYDFLVRRLFSGNIGLSTDHPLETLGVFENENVQKVYWVDGVHQLRCINIADTTTRDVGNTTQFDANPTLALNHTISITKRNSGGEFPAGTIQYAFTYHNQYGPETNIFETSPLYELCPKTKGVAADGRTTCSFLVNITGTDIHFEFVRAYAIVRTSANSSPAVRLLGDFNNQSGNITFVDNGSIGSSVDAASLLFVGGEPVCPATFTTKDGTLFLGNIKFTRPSIGTLPYGNITLAEKIADMRDAGTIPITNVRDTVTGVGSGSWFYDYKIDNNRPSTSLRRFKCGEGYRLGIIAQHETGIWSEVLWLGDYDNTISPTFVGSQSSGKFVLSRTSDFVPILTALLNGGYKRIAPVVVYPEGADRKVFCQGLVSATVYNVEDRFNNRPFSQASWFFRPISEGFGIAALPHATLYPNKLNVYSTSGTAMSQIMGGAEIEINDNPRVFLPQVKGYWADQQASSEAVLPAEDMVSLYGNDYFVDTSIVTLNSPDIDLDDSLQQEDFDALKFRVVGVAYSGFPSTNIETSVDITPGSVTDIKMLEYSKSRYLKYSNTFGMSTSFNYCGFTYPVSFATGFLTTPVLYPWHSTGDLTGGRGLNDGEEPFIPPVLAHKVLSNIWFARTVMLDNSVNVGNDDVKFFDSTQSAFVPLGDTADSKVYYGDVDSVRVYKKDLLSAANKSHLSQNFNTKEPKVLGQTASLSNTARSPISTSDFTPIIGPVIYTGSDNVSDADGIVSGGIDGSLLAYGYIRQKTFGSGGVHLVEKKNPAVPIKYKSTRHAVIPLSHNAYHIPSLYRCNALHNIAGNTVHPFWDSGNQYTFDSGYLPFITEWSPSVTFNKTWTGNKEYYRNTTPNVPTLYIGELYREFDQQSSATRFGGNTEKALLGNIWNRCGDALSINGMISGAGTLDYVEGDAYLARYDCLKTYPYADKDTNSIVEIFSTDIETRVNLDSRYDNARGLLDNTLVTPENINLVNRMGYEQANNFFTYATQDYSRESIDDLPASVAITGEKIPGAQVDAWMQIPMTAVQDLDGVYGELKALKTFNNDVYAFQENGFSQIIFNARVQIPTSDGQPIEIASGMKFQGVRYLSNKIGCADKWTIGISNSKMYWFDRGSKDIWAFGSQGLDNISTRLGVKGFVEKWFKTPWTVLSPNLRTLHEETYNDMYFVFGNDNWDERGALLYSESLDSFISVLDYAGVQNIYSIADKSFMLTNTSVHQMWGGNYNSFFGILKPYVLRFVANAQPTMHKVFDTVQWRSDSWNASGKYLPNETFNKLQVWNQYQRTTQTSLTNTPGKPSPLKKKFNTFRALIPRDKEGNSLTTTDMRYKGINRIRGNYAVVELTHDILDTNKMQFYDLEISEFL